MKKFIILDNGHGTREHTKGKCAPDKSFFEGEWARDQVSLIAKLLEDNNIEYTILVPEKEDISLSERVRRANAIYKSKKDAYDVVLVSIHCDAAGSDGQWHSARGVTVWVSKNASNKSKETAKMIGYEAGLMGLRGNRYIPKDQWHQADYYILKNTRCPAVLVENLFMDNKEDLAWLKDDGYRMKLAKMVVEGLKK